MVVGDRIGRAPMTSSGARPESDLVPRAGGKLSSGSNEAASRQLDDVVTSKSGLAQITATPLRQPTTRLLNGLFADDDQLRPSPYETNGARQQKQHAQLGYNRRAASSCELSATVASLQPQQRPKQQPSAPTTSAPQSQNKTIVIKQTNKPFGAQSNPSASFALGAVSKGASNLNLCSGAAPATCQDCDDTAERALGQVCGLLNISDRERVLSAALIIQRAFRKRQICNRFRIITEQLRHACNGANANKPPNCDAGELQSDGGAGDAMPFVSGTTRAAAWESLSQAASRLAARAAAKQAQIQQQQQRHERQPNTHSQTTVTKSASSQQVASSESNRQSNNFSSHSQLRSSSAVPSLLAETPKHSQNIQPQQQQSSSTAGPNQLKSAADEHQSSAVAAAALGFQQLEALRKRQYRVGLNVFNKNPEKGISFLIAHSFIDCSSPISKSSTSYYLANQLHFIDKQNLAHQQTESSLLSKQLRVVKQQQIVGCQFCVEEENLKRNIAHFLLNRKGLAKEKIGQYLGNLQSQFNQDVVRYYLQELDFAGLQIDAALRKFSSTLRMPGEAQKIERFVDYFAQRYIQCQQQQASTTMTSAESMANQQQQQQQQSASAFQQSTKATPTGNNSKRQQQQQPSGKRNQSATSNNSAQRNQNNLTLLSRDEIFILTFAIIMLNTDLHSPSLKSQARMSGQQFINNLRGVFKSQTINESDLMEIYERVKAQQIVTAPDHVSHVLKVQQGLTVNNFQKKDSIPNLCTPHRRLVCFCRLFEVYDVNKKERPGQHQREIFLFNDMLLVTKLARRARASTQQQYTYRQSIPLQGLYVQLFQSTHYTFGIRLCRKTNDETLILFNARNELDQSRFVGDLSESIAEMEEMETIRVHNIIETIHFKHQERLRRHSMMHDELQASQMVANATTASGGADARDKLARRGLPMVDFATRSSKKSTNCTPSDPGDQLVILEEDSVAGKQLQQQQQPQRPPSISGGNREEQNKENNLRLIGGSDGDQTSQRSKRTRRLRSKFSSMSNLSCVSEGRDDEDAQHRSDGDTNELPPPRPGASNRSRIALQQGANGELLRREPSSNAALASRRPQGLVSGGIGQRNGGAGGAQRSSERLNANHRSQSSASVHSLDSGLFLSRDVSPNQSG